MTDTLTGDDLVVHLRDRPGACAECGAGVPAGLTGAAVPGLAPVCAPCLRRIAPELSRLLRADDDQRRRLTEAHRFGRARLHLATEPGACTRCGAPVPAGPVVVRAGDPHCRQCAMAIAPDLARLALLHHTVAPLVHLDAVVEMGGLDRDACRDVLAALLVKAKVLRVDRPAPAVAEPGRDDGGPREEA